MMAFSATTVEHNGETTRRNSKVRAKRSIDALC